MGSTVERIAKERGHSILTRFDDQHVVSSDALAGVECVIDFSNASAIEGLVDAAVRARVNLVIGTTGWQDRVDMVRRKVEDAGVAAVFAANFSPGATILFALARRAGELFAQVPGYEAGLEERHHSQKKDAPSGTAIRAAREVELGSDGKIVPQIVSSRVGFEYGLHTVFFDSQDDLVEISHRARNRDGFARGAVLAAERLEGQKGFFTFEELIGF
jgi:4-hydroxy-tetrahydrodipicolinate reductase